MERFKPDQFDLDKLLGYYEILAFTNNVIWPAVDHIYGSDFRSRAQRKKRLHIPRKTKPNNEGHNPERITVDAHSNPTNKFVDFDTGELIIPCAVNIRVEEMCPDLKEGIMQIIAQGIQDEDDRWWHDDGLNWQPWESRNYHFSTDPSMPLSVIYTVEAHDNDENTPVDRFLWEFADEISPILAENIPVHGIGRKKYLKKLRHINEHINDREEDFMYMLSWRECLEIRAALIRFGVPAQVLKLAA